MSTSVAEPAAGERDSARSGRLPLARFEIVWLGAFAVLFAALTYFFPRSGDDWAWGSSIGTDRLHRFFANYNGRYAGNLFILFLTRATYLIPLFEAAIVALTLWVLLDLVGNRTRMGYAAAITLFMGMPLGNWRQAIQWASGFSNYAPATLGLLLFLRGVKADWLGTLSNRRRPLRLVAILVAGFVFALFMENVTLYLAAASVAYVVAHRLVRKRFSPDSLAWAVAFVAATAVMFSNAAYRRTDSSESLHHAAHTTLKGKVVKLFDPIANFTVTNNWLLNVGLVIVLLIVVSAHRDRIRRRWAMFITASALGSLVVAFALLAANHETRLRALWRCFAGVSAVLLLVALVTTAFAVFSDRFRRVEILVAVASVLVLIAPLVLVDPIGPRQFYVTYLIFMGLVLLLLRDVTGHVEPWLMQRLVPLVAVVGVAIFAWYFRIYGVVHSHADDRLAHIRAKVASGVTAVTVRPLSYGDYVHNGDPRTGVLEYRYKLYYGLPSDLTIKVEKAKKK